MVILWICGLDDYIGVIDSNLEFYKFNYQHTIINIITNKPNYFISPLNEIDLKNPFIPVVYNVNAANEWHHDSDDSKAIVIGIYLYPNVHI